MPSLVWASTDHPPRAKQGRPGRGTLGDTGALLRHPQEVGATGEPGLSGSGSRLVPALLSPAATLCSHPGGPCELERPRQFPVCAGYFWKWLSDLFLSQAPDRRSRHGPRHLLQRGLCKAQGPCASQGWGWQSATHLGMKMSLKPGRRKALVSCWGRLMDTELWPGEAVACLSRLAFSLVPSGQLPMTWALPAGSSTPRPRPKPSCAREPLGAGRPTPPLPVPTPACKGPQNSLGCWCPGGPHWSPRNFIFALTHTSPGLECYACTLTKPAPGHGHRPHRRGSEDWESGGLLQGTPPPWRRGVLCHLLPGLGAQGRARQAASSRCTELSSRCTAEGV